MYYFAIVGDYSTKCTEIDKEELFRLEKTLPKEVAEAYQSGRELTPPEQKKAAQLLSISYHCMSGWLPVGRHSNKVKCAKLPTFVRDEYLYAFIRNFLVVIQRFDRDKGAWGQYVKFIRSMAIRDTLAYLRKLDKKKALQAEMMRLAEQYTGDYYVDSDGNPIAIASEHSE